MPRRPAESAAPIDAETVLDLLRQRATRETLDGMARYAIPSDRAFGVMMRDMQSVAKRVGRSHDLAEALWRTGWYEARMVASMVDVPAYVTSAQMESWCADFDSWAIVDTVCFHLFDRSPHAWEKVAAWCDRDEEFVRRAGFALIACLVAHDKTAPDAAFLACLPRIEAGATDDRNFVQKGVSWALRMLGRRGPAVHAGALALATRLAASPDAAARWVGKDALRDLTRQPPASKKG